MSDKQKPEEQKKPAKEQPPRRRETLWRGPAGSTYITWEYY